MRDLSNAQARHYAPDEVIDRDCTGHYLRINGVMQFRRAKRLADEN